MTAIILWCGVPAAMLGLLGGWWLMSRALAPLEALTSAVETIHERNLHERLPRTGNGDELDRLTEVFNAMTARLDESFQRIREFTLHASHELKTPLTVMQGELETAWREETLSDAERERVFSQLDEVQRLAKIVDGLSLLTKADAGQITLALEPVRMHDIVREAVEDAQHLAQGQNVQVGLAACEDVSVRGDRHRLRQLLLNLTDNAIKYNRPDGTVTLSLRRVDLGRARGRQHRTGHPARPPVPCLRPLLQGGPEPRQRRGGGLRPRPQHRAVDRPCARRQHPARLRTGGPDDRDGAAAGD